MSSLGPTKTTEKDYYKVNLEDGLILLLTSDGVHDYMDQRMMADIVGKRGSLKGKSKTLVDVALDGNSNDNLSVIMVQAKL
jgi:protein phosphatase